MRTKPTEGDLARVPTMCTCCTFFDLAILLLGLSYRLSQPVSQYCNGVNVPGQECWAYAVLCTSKVLKMQRKVIYLYFFTDRYTHTHTSLYHVYLWGKKVTATSLVDGRSDGRRKTHFSLYVFCINTF